MAEEDSGSQDKTEEPSARKLEKAAEDGQVLSSKEMFVFTTLIMGLMMLTSIPFFLIEILSVWKLFFLFDLNFLENASPLIGIGKLIKQVIIITLLVGVPLILTILVTQMAVGGINFAPKSFHFKANRINLFSGLKRIFSSKGLVELIKSLFKVGLLGGITYSVIYVNIIDVISLSERNLFDALASLLSNFPKLAISLLIVLGFIALIDFMWQKYQHIEKLKMTHKEVKDENKDTDGNPEVKQKIRRLQNEISNRTSAQKAALENVKDASAIITNPTHFAVAIKYVVGEEGAPIILAMGRGMMAEKIIKLANDSNVTVFQSPLLARALYFTGEIGKEISENLYTAIASVLAYIFKIERGEDIDYPDFNIPDEMNFDEYGKKIK
ncbi:EscU/YscU/HrcU family type III secretion system export apparatus switch protein [Alphaproteobacteria bacterium]|nr:EscU/YscU/HrcU family type III secretion system export apparatus switch protein [Alphaproteobacteria bacterium]